MKPHKRTMNGVTTTLVQNAIAKSGFPGAWLNWYFYWRFCSDSLCKWDETFEQYFDTPDESLSYYGIGTCHPSINIWPSTGVTTCQINLIFTDTIHVVRPIHYTGDGPCSSLNMCILTQLLIFALWSFPRRFFKLEHSNLVQLEP